MAIAAGGKKINFDKKTITDKKTGVVSTFKKVKSSGGGSSIVIESTNTIEIQQTPNGEMVKIVNVPKPVVEEVRFYTNPSTGKTTRETISQTNTRREVQSGAKSSQTKINSFQAALEKGAMERAKRENEQILRQKFNYGSQFQSRKDNQPRDLVSYYNAQTIKQVDKIAKEQGLNTVQREQLLRQSVKGESKSFAPKYISSKDALNAAVKKQTGSQLKELNLSPQSFKNKNQKVSVSPTEIKQLKELDIQANKGNTNYVLRELYKVPKWFILTNADFVALGLTGVQKLTEKSINGVANTIGYFTKRTDLVVRQAKGITGKNYIQKGQSIEGTLKSDWNKIFKTAERVGVKSWNGYKKTLSVTEKGLTFIGQHPKETGIIVATFGALQGKRYLNAFAKEPGKTIGQTLAFLTPLSGSKKLVTPLAKLSPSYIEKTSKGFKIKKGLTLKLQSVSTGAKSLSFQASIAGKRITAVNASAEQLTSLISRKKLIRKPISANEDKFPVKIKSLLNKFDSGKKLTTKEFAYVNKWLRTNQQPNITLLERSLYADPESGLRLSRLKVNPDKKATFKDILKGNFKLISNTQKPQVLIFENAEVAKFPPNLKDIERKLKKNQKLTEKETNRLIAWQVKSGSGKFKPIGSTIYQGGREFEVTIAPGEYIKRVKGLGFTYIGDTKVTFVSAKIWKPEKSILSKMKKAQQGKLSNKQIISLEKELSKKLGRKVRVDNPKLKNSRSRVKDNRPILRLEGRGIRVLKNRTGKRASTTRAGTRTGVRTGTRASTRTGVRTGTRASTRTGVRTGTRASTRTGVRTGTRASTRTEVRTGKRGGRGIFKTIPPRVPPPVILKFKDKLPKGYTYAYDAKVRVKGKVKTIKLGLPTNRALRKVGKLIDNTTSRSMQLVPIGIIKKTKDISKPTVLGKFRVRKGKKALILVEKSKHTIDTRGEKRGLSISKALRPKKKTKKVIKKKIIKKSSKKIKSKIKKTNTKKKKTR